MLKHLRITNFAILSDVALDLAPGFNVLSGETGAGKSLIVDAVALLRGGRASADIPRAGADEAVVEAIFEPSSDLADLARERLFGLGLSFDESSPEILVRRVISAKGRSRVHINGGLTTAAALAEIGSLLVDLAGQHEHQGLVDPSRHAEILDAFGVPPDLSTRVQVAYERARAAAGALEGGDVSARSRAEREDFLCFQVEEIDGAELKEGEEQELLAERDRLRAAGKLGACARRGEEALYSREGAVVDVLSTLVKEIEALVHVDPRLAGPKQQVEEARLLCEDAAVVLRRYGDSVAEDPERLAEVEERLHLISRLCKKHGATVGDVLNKRARLAAELAELQAHESRRAELARELDVAREQAALAAAELSDARKHAAFRLEAATSEALAELGMGSARVMVQVEPRLARETDGDALVAGGRRLSPRGWDRVEFLLCANKGEEPRPLAKVASGGELSRIMLALKLCLRHADMVGTYVFDEVDAGIGGGTAEVVGRLIRRVAETRQVICVTHLPQIAAMGNAHFRVEKAERDGRTETKVTRLSPGERREE
ncbi:MAG: DNA repair protein RecN, partial [Deltaproteobacteria bacterium]|nr:DNA repair protein RecN [Deltaproteobacteria bacterium]